MQRTIWIHVAMRLALLTVVITPASSWATATIITDPNDTTIRFKPPSGSYISPRKTAPTTDEDEPPSQASCSPAREGHTRYNAAADVKTLEFCDGSRWVGLLKVAPSVSNVPRATCSAGEESLVRYNKHKDSKAYEYCDGAIWRKMGESSLAVSSQFFDRPFMRNAKTPALLTNGAFHENGYVGALVSCNGGINHLSIFMTLHGEKEERVAAATAQNNRLSSTDIDQASLFSYVPRNTPWKLWVRDNNSDGFLNKAHCTVKVTRFGE